MSTRIAQLLSKLKGDPWRAEVGFSQEIQAVNEALFKRGLDKVEMADLINGWIHRYQPCLFGKIAARHGLISYCVLTDADLNRSDESISGEIEEAHTRWSREAFQGDKSAFVLAAISDRITYAEPNASVLSLAQTLCSFLLRTDVQPDRIYLDEVLLELPTQQDPTWRWDVGVNYFCAHGDKRWWHDHRIPGGMAFSTNSVGHMVKSGKLALAMQKVEEVMDVDLGPLVNTPVTSLDKALELAMRTIRNASDAISGKATELLPLPEDLTELAVERCPIRLPVDLADRDFCEYLGRYHTDYTVPSEYFLPDVERPANLETHTLDFTYLFHDTVHNPDFLRMGEGRRVRAGLRGPAEPIVDRVSKRGKGFGEPIAINEQALRNRGLR